jgi:putative membrane protein
MMKQEEPSSQDLARFRTEWADERTRMAAERTFAAWIRTGLALVAGGLATARLLTSIEPGWLVRSMGVILIVLGGTVFALGFRTYREMSKEMKEEEIEATSVWFPGLMTLMLLLAGAFALILVFV